MDPILESRGVTKTYKLGQTKVNALKGVDLKLFPGDFTALVGASGSGKSTLLNILGVIDSPDEGEVFFNGKPTQSMSEQQKNMIRNEHIGFIFQAFHLVPVLTAFENVELPLTLRKKLSRSDRKERVNKALISVGLEDFGHHLPDKLSGGQRQRVAIARALVGHPSFILADEPTANLDSENTRRIIDLLLGLNATNNVTFLFSTHDEKLMSRVTKIVRIADGMIVS